MADDGISADFWIPKDGVFLSRETETMFILTARLKGFRKGNLKISISADGSQLTITGEKPIQKQSPYKKDRETRGFEKVFKIPDGVDLDLIIAYFKKEESTLTVEMPKLKKGMLGVGVQEVLEQENMTLMPLSSQMCRVAEGYRPRLYYQDWALHKPAAAGREKESSSTRRDNRKDGEMQPKFGTPEEKPDTNNQIATDGSHVQAPVDMQEEKSSRQEKDSPKMKIEHEEIADLDRPCEHGPTVTEKAEKPEGGKDAWETDDGRHIATDGSHVQAPVDMQEENSSRQEKDSPKMKIEHEEAVDHDGPCEHGPTVTEKAGKPKGGKDAWETDDGRHIATDGSHVQAPVDMQEEKSSRQEKGSLKMKIEHEEAADHDGPCEHGPTVTKKGGKPEGGKDAWETDDGQHVSKKESSSVFTPCVLMGSALIASIVVVLVGFMNKSKRQQ